MGVITLKIHTKKGVLVVSGGHSIKGGWGVHQKEEKRFIHRVTRIKTVREKILIPVKRESIVMQQDRRIQAFRLVGLNKA